MEQIFKTIIFLIIFFSFICAKDYYISYQLISKNGILVFYQLNYSKCFTKSITKNKVFLFKIKVIKKNKYYKLLYIYQNEIFENLLKYQNAIYTYNKLINFHLKSIQKLTFPPKRFDIILKDGYLYFYLRK